MTPRQRVQAALRHQSVDRAPRDCWALPYIRLFRSAEWEALQSRFPMDIGYLWAEDPTTLPPELERLRQPGTYRDEWGSLWEVAEAGVIGEVRQPALVEWSALDHWRVPDDLPDDARRRAADRQCRSRDEFILSPVSARPFERLQFLRGSEQLFLDLAEDPPELGRLLEMVHGYYRELVRGWAESACDGVFLMDDWGSQTSLLISPSLWRARFKPLYREYCEIIHRAGKAVFFHSDGHIAAVLEDLVEVGVDALNSQLFCMDLEDLGRRYAGRLTFWGEIDRQRVLPFGTVGEVHAAVRRVRAALDHGRGGVIAQCEWGKDNPAHHIAAVYEAWLT